ncbi:hypothetical protein HGH92_24080 [Chitinophaga varians]|uniref:Uncharacterized protein n=1 Tax=Chitinophaga varians TaxID=2202339 RepID=A0A847RZF7_9BACT|nr:DUF6731 family protein [Chitinophaga varians]NLR67404.1 hypothetical protein [Chitinophaga varians]
MSNTRFYMFHVVVTPKVDSEIRSFKEMLDHIPSSTDPMKKNDNKFNLDGDVVKRNGIYRGTFCLSQGNSLPPKVKFGSEPQNLELDEDEGLGYYTSFFYDSDTQMIMVQYNRNGITANGIASFFKKNFSEFIRKIEFKVVINPADLLRLGDFTEIRKVELSIAQIQGGGVLANDGVMRSFNELNSISDKTNANTINITLGMGFASGGMRRSAISNLLRLLQRADQGQGSITKMEVTGKEEDEGAMKVIDFITNKVIIDVSLPRYRHMNPTTLRSIINDAIVQYDLIKPQIATYRVRSRPEE